MSIVSNSFVNKQLFSLWTNSSKYPLENFSHITHKKIVGHVWLVGFNINETRFTMSDFIRLSKKLRSNVIEKIELDISVYHIRGILIKKSGNIYNRTYLIRNVFSSIPYETNVSLHSPAIEYVVVDHHIQVRYHRQKLLYLRQKPLPQSKVIFTYIVGVIPLNKEDEIFLEETSSTPFTYLAGKNIQ